MSLSRPLTCQRVRSPPRPPMSLSARCRRTLQSSTCAASAALRAVASSKAASKDAIFCSTVARRACGRGVQPGPGCTARAVVAVWPVARAPEASLLCRSLLPSVCVAEHGTAPAVAIPCNPRPQRRCRPRAPAPPRALQASCPARPAPPRARRAWAPPTARRCSKGASRAPTCRWTCTLSTPWTPPRG